MAEKKLDFTAPLISVRRSSSKIGYADGVENQKIENSAPCRQHSLSVCKPESELLGEVAKPGSVPFLWEHIPGKAKGEKVVKSQHTEKPSIAPKLPPGKTFGALKQIPGKKSGDQKVHPSNMPRHPSAKAMDIIKRISGKISGDLSRPKIEASSFNDHAALLDMLKDDINTKGDSDFENDEYSDALDTLSHTESISFNCSVTGWNDHDSLGVKPSGTFSLDPQTLDFMMSRFLPAAKAMVIETPQYATPRKPPTVIECQRSLPRAIIKPVEVKKVATRERKPLLEKYGSRIVSHYDQYAEDVVSTEDEEDDHESSQKKSAKACGLFPRLCVKNSLLLLNPMPGTKLRNQTMTPSARKDNKKTGTARSGPLDKHDRDVVHKKFHSGILSQELPEAKSKQMGGVRKYSYSGEIRRTDGLSPFRSCRSGGISPYRNRIPQSTLHDGANFLGTPRNTDNVAVSKASLSNKKVSDSASPAVEKTVYIDSVNSMEVPVSNILSSNGEKLVKNSCDKFKTLLLESREVDETCTAKPSNQDTKCVSKSEVSVPSSVVYATCTFGTYLKSQGDTNEGLKLDQILDQECKETCSNGTVKQSSTETKDQENNRDGDLPSPLPPPLPKSPSESWLWRALPLRNPFSLGSQLNFKEDPNASSAGTKWETIVKTSNVHHDHVRYSEELMPHVPQHSEP